MFNHPFNNDPDVISAIWAIDAESGREYLINLVTSEIIAERVDGKIIDPGASRIKTDTSNQ